VKFFSIYLWKIVSAILKDLIDGYIFQGLCKGLGL